MDYEELNLYNQAGGENLFLKEHISKNKEEVEDDSNKDCIIKKYRKKIIEQRNEIERLKKYIQKFEK